MAPRFTGIGERRDVPPPPEPCETFPDDASYKTVGLVPCAMCGSRNCWLGYLRWEVATGITLNAEQHHRVEN